MCETKETVENAEIEVSKEELEEECCNRVDLSKELKEFLQIAGEKVIKHQAFKLLDLDGDGSITIEELKTLIEKIGGSMSEAEATALIKEADKDGNNVIDYVEFTKLWSALRGEGEEEKEIRGEFRKLDTDASGYITRDEMLAVIVNCDHFSGDKIDEARKCVEELDVDKDGRVSYPEFLLVWKYRQ